MIFEVTAIGVGSSIAAAWFLSRIFRFSNGTSRNDEWELLEWQQDMEETLNAPGPGLLQMCRTPAE